MLVSLYTNSYLSHLIFEERKREWNLTHSRLNNFRTHLKNLVLNSNIVKRFHLTETSETYGLWRSSEDSNALDIKKTFWLLIYGQVFSTSNLLKRVLKSIRRATCARRQSAIYLNRTVLTLECAAPTIHIEPWGLIYGLLRCVIQIAPKGRDTMTNCNKWRWLTIQPIST